MALKMPKLFGEPKPKLAAAEVELDMPTTQVKMGASAPSGYDPLASVSVMEQLRAATAKSIAPWKLPLIGDLPVAKQLSVLGTVFGTALVLALLMIMLDNRAASQGAAATATATYDHFGSLGTPIIFWKEMSQAGVRIRASHPFKWTAPFRYVGRDHRKLIVIDFKKAFTGGLNIANEYSGLHLRRKSRGWRDTGIMIEGSIVNELLETFKRSWTTWRGKRIEFPQEGEEPHTKKDKAPSLPFRSSSILEEVERE